MQTREILRAVLFVLIALWFIKLQMFTEMSELQECLMCYQLYNMMCWEDYFANVFVYNYKLLS